MLTALLCLAFSGTAVFGKASPADFLSKPEAWYRSAEGLRITTNILSWQAREGAWPKNLDTTQKPFTGDPGTLKGTFDNGATFGEMRFLARALKSTGDARCETAVTRGLVHVLKAQYPTGGWPQSYPPGPQYHRHITFNDHAMVHVLEFLREVATSPEFAFLGPERRKAAQESFDRGIQCILKCQIRSQGRLTVWCAQHDEMDLRPCGGRTYELPSLSGSESAGILLFLMSLDNPSPELVRAVKGGAEWFEAAKITGIRVEKRDGVQTAVAAQEASPLWARFYDLENGQPIFSDRDGIKKFSYNEIGRERRNGYAWYGDWGMAVARRYAEWKQKWVR